MPNKYNLSDKELKGEFESVKLLPEKALFIESKTKKHIIISDIHIGIESYFVSQGVFFPEYQMPTLKKNITRLSKISNECLIINGDLKHNFKGFGIKEYKLVEEFLSFSKKLFKEIIVIKGNHDTFIEKITEKLNISLKEDLVLRTENNKEYLIEHGHRKISIENNMNLILGHEHPSITLSDNTGVGIKIPIFLFYKNQRDIIVLPSFSPLSPGTDILKLSKSMFLTNILKEKGTKDFFIYGIYDNELFFLGKEKEVID